MKKNAAFNALPLAFLRTWIPDNLKSGAYQLALVLFLLLVVVLRGLLTPAPAMAAADALANRKIPEFRRLNPDTAIALVSNFSASPMNSSARLMLLGELSQQAQDLGLILRNTEIFEGSVRVSEFESQRVEIQLSGPTGKQLEFIRYIQECSRPVRIVGFQWAPGKSQISRILSLQVEMLIKK